MFHILYNQMLIKLYALSTPIIKANIIVGYFSYISQTAANNKTLCRLTMTEGFIFVYISIF